MTPISIPYHLFIPALTCLILLILIAIKWKSIFIKSKRKSTWAAIVVFLIIYMVIVGDAMFTDIYCQWDLNKYDLNMNGIFESDEINPLQQAAYQRLISDTGRNFAVISGLLFAAVISFIVFLVGQGYRKYKRLKSE